MLNNTSNDTTRDNTAGLSARAVRLARRNMCKNTDEDRSGHASATSSASPPSATTPSPPSASTPSPVASSSPPMIRPELTSHSPTVPPTVVGFKSNDECIQERYNSAIKNGDVIVLEGSPVASTVSTVVVDWSLPGETSKYVGAWKDDRQHGEGTYTWADGRKYVGAWKDDQMHGQGTYTWPSGSKYVGAYKYGKRHGQGTYTWADGNKYVGAFKDDKRHGQGTYTWPSGRKYVGAYKDGKKHGQGTYTWADGRKYVGAFRDGKEHGQGTVIYADGRKYVGVWKDDKMQGNNGETINELKKKSSITHSDIGSKYNPITKEEIYEWNGIWYLVDGSGPAGQRWRGQGHGSDWRPNSEEEEEYEVWYEAYTANVLTRGLDEKE